MAVLMCERLSINFCAPNEQAIKLLKTWVEERKNGELLLRLGKDDAM